MLKDKEENTFVENHFFQDQQKQVINTYHINVKFLIIYTQKEIKLSRFV